MDSQPKLSEPQLAAWRAFLTAHARVIGRIDAELAGAGRLPLGSYDVLIELAGAPGHRLRMSRLARQVVLSNSGLTRLVDRLEKQGLLRREVAPTDRRGAYAVLTAEGLAALREAWPVYARGIAAHFGRYLSPDEATTLATALDRIAEAAATDAPRSFNETLRED